MKQSTPCQQLRELIDTDLPPAQLERLARIDAVLRVAVARDRDGASERMRPSISAALDGELSELESIRMREHPSLRLVATPSAAAGARQRGADRETHELKLTFSELALVYKSLQAVRTLGALPPQDELLDDTIRLVDQALNRAI
jgi:hypothetical protein